MNTELREKRGEKQSQVQTEYLWEKKRQVGATM